MTGQAQSFSTDKINKKFFFPSGFNAGCLVKRLFDILVSFFGLLLFSPIFAFVAVSIKRDSPGPVFFQGLRAGRGGNSFKILKFRTMYHNQESYTGPKVTAGEDPRITPFGRWLRDHKVNELPQLWNVLKGDMSLVGPRPEDPEIAAEWPEEVRQDILSVRPGITSPASIIYRDEESQLNNDHLMDTYLNAIAPNKQRLDQLYVRHRSFWLDLDVILWTFLVLIPQANNYQPQETLLYSGPASRFVSRYLNWFLIDAIIAFLSIGFTAVIWRSFGPLNVGWDKSIIAAITFALIFSICGSIFGMQRVQWRNARSGDLLTLIPSIILATIIILVLNKLVLSERSFPVAMLFFASGLAFLLFTFVRYRRQLYHSASVRWVGRRSIALATCERLIVVGGGEAGQFAAWLLSGHQAFQVVGFVDDDLYKQGVHIGGLPVIGRREELAELVTKHDVGVVVFAIHKIRNAERNHLLDICAKSGAQVLLFPDFLSVLNTTIEMNAVRSQPVTGPFVHSWPGIAPAQVERWFDTIHQTIADEGVQAGLDQIDILRRTIKISQKDEQSGDSTHQV